VLRIRAEDAGILERHLFDEAYKSVTDLVTKFVWPAPAYRVAQLCAGRGISPNAVTAVSLLLVLAVIWLFAEGRFVTGLVAAWLMTFLDTVDGKLARVTVTSSKIGHNFDHGIDLIHPPLWYTAWACGLAGDSSRLSPSDPILVAIFAGYIAGRISERSFTRIIAGFSLYSWRPFDSFFRLITGRRNSNLLLLTGSTAWGRPDVGLEMVAVWTVVSTIVLGIRVAQAIASKSRKSTLQPWIVEVGSDMSLVPRYARSFTAKPTAASRLAS